LARQPETAKVARRSSKSEGGLFNLEPTLFCLEPAAANNRPTRMHGTLEPIKLAATPRRSTTARIIALAVAAGIVAGALLVYTPLGDQLFTFLGITDPKDCG
jgi:hypothetical protein